MKSTLGSRVVLIILAVHAVLVPIAVLSLDAIVRDSHVGLLRDFADDTARRRCYLLERSDMRHDDEALLAFLDSTVEDGDTVYAELDLGGRKLYSRFNDDVVADGRPNDVFDYASNNGVYFHELSCRTPDGNLLLRIGLDERPTLAHIASADRYILAIFAGYLAVILGLALLLSRALTRPINALGRLAQRVATGQFGQTLHTDSQVPEFRSLATSLETMRAQLVEARERQRREAELRRNLEAEVSHRRRLETVGTLAGGLAHELNNVLLPMTLYTESALEKLPADSPAAPKLRRVVSLGQRASDIIGKVLAFSRHRPAQDFEALSIAGAVQEALATFDAVRPHNVELRQEIAADCGNVRADSTSVAQIVLNLCSNALHALPEAGGWISVRLRPINLRAGEAPGELNAGRYVELSVGDNGHGMDETTLARVFDPFFTTRTSDGGTGLGLSVVHGIVRGLGGATTVASQLGQGTTFRVYLPSLGGPDILPAESAPKS